MKSVNYWIALLCVCVLASCDNSPKFHIEGQITEAENKTLYWEQSGMNGVVTLDSVVLDKDGKFAFKGNRPQAPDFYRLRIDKQLIHLAIDSIERVMVRGSLPHFSLDYTVEGSESNQKIKELVRLQSQLQEKVNAVNRAQLPIGVARDSIGHMIEAYKEDVKKRYIFAEPNKSYAYFALFQELEGTSIFNPFDKDDNKCFAAVATSLNLTYPHGERTRNLYNMVVRGMRNNKRPVVQTLPIDGDQITETGLIDISLKDIKGRIQTLSDLKGKVVILDFMAYGTETSGAHNLLLRELRHKYGAQGLEIYQVSLDVDEHYWKTAADPLPWICVRDPQGLYSSPAATYQVQKLPTLFLIDKNGELAGRIENEKMLEKSVVSLLSLP